MNVHFGNGIDWTPAPAVPYVCIALTSATEHCRGSFVFGLRMTGGCVADGLTRNPQCPNGRACPRIVRLTVATRGHAGGGFSVYAS